MKSIYLTTLATFFTTSLLAQVGIGTTSPNTNSILDLSNTNNKVLVLPTISNTTTGSIGSVYFNTTDSTLNYHNGVNYNSLSAWKYKYGTGSIGVSTKDSVGIGISVPQAKLHIKGNGGVLELEGTDHSFLSLYPDGHSNGRKAYLGFIVGATDDITLKNETTTGNVVVDFTNTTTGKLNVKGKVQERGYDLVPQGAIIMWSGATIPNGWALCDGGSYAKLDGLGNVTVPDLRERFIVGSGGNNTTNTAGTLSTNGYAVNTFGGKDTVALSISQLPSHSHLPGTLGGTTSLDGAHSHSISARIVGNENGTNEWTWATKAGTWDRSTNSAGDHSHTLNITSGSTASTGSGNSHENRPPYYALAFIIKL